MKLAIVIALAPDRRSGRVLSDLLPADKAIDQVKKAIIGNQCPDARFPILQAIKLDSKFREHRFRVLSGDVEADSEDDAPSSVNIASLIPVEIGEGEQIVIINVTTENEAEFLRDLSSAVVLASKEIPKLQGQLAAAQKAADLLSQNTKIAEEVIVRQKADLEAKDKAIEAGNAQIETITKEVQSGCERIKELEAQLAEAAAKAKKAAK